MSAAPTPDEAPRPLRTIVRAFVEQEVEGLDLIDEDKLIRATTLRFANDPEFAQAAARDLVAEIVPSVLSNLMHAQNREMLQIASGYVSKSKLDLTARERFTNVFQGTGRRQYASLMGLVGPQLDDLNTRDYKQIGTMTRVCRLRGFLRTQLPDDETPVKELPDSVLDKAWERFQDPTNGNGDLAT